MTPRTFDAYQALAQRGAMTPAQLSGVLACTATQARRVAQRLADTEQARRRCRQGCRGYVYEVVR